MNKNIKDHALEYIDDETAINIEDTLWWLTGRKTIIQKYLQAALQKGVIKKIMDIGCGSGGNFDVLSKFGDVMGVERSVTLAKRAKYRNIASIVYNKDFFEIDFEEDINLFTLFDVLEHIQDDSAFISRLAKKACPNHMLLISVPACKFLYSQHDQILHHYRRYSKKELQALLQHNGYEIIVSSYFMFFFFPAALLLRLKEKYLSLKNQTQINIGKAPTCLNKLLINVMRAEAFLSQFVSFPIGLWIFVLAKHTNQQVKFHQNKS